MGVKVMSSIAALLVLLSGCVNELPAINDKIDALTKIISIQPTTTAIGSPVNVAIEGTLSFSEMSSLPT